MAHQPSADDVKSAIDAAAVHLPDLQVVITTNRLHHPWHIDLERTVIYVDAVTHPETWPAALLAALAALCAHHHVHIGAEPRQHLHLISSIGCAGPAAATTTGTHGR